MDKNHPSFGSRHIWFLFSVGNKSDRLGFVITEAGNRDAIYTLEEILEQHDGSVNDNCNIVAVFRDAGSIGIRNQEIATYVKYVDFLLDYVNPSYIMSDISIVECMGKSLSKEDRDYARAKMGSITPAVADDDDEGDSWEVFNEQKPVKNEPMEDTKDYHVLTGALESLGFKKPIIKKFVTKLGNRIGKEPIQSLIKEAVRGFTQC